VDAAGREQARRDAGAAADVHQQGAAGQAAAGNDVLDGDGGVIRPVLRVGVGEAGKALRGVEAGRS